MKEAPDVNDTLRAEGSGAVRGRLERARRYNGAKTEEKLVQLGKPRPPAFTDEALALRFAETHANDLRYVAGWGRWLFFDGTRWRFDETLLAFDRARQICREAAAECKTRLARVLASAKTVAAVEQLAKADRRLAATVDQWDADPWALNTPLGILDLRTGKLRPHRWDDYVTKITGVAPDASCETPIWHKFLYRVMGGDAVLAAGDWVRAHRIDARTRAVLPVRDRRQRQDHFPQRNYRLHQRLPPHRAHRDLHRSHRGASSDRSRRLAWRSNS